MAQAKIWDSRATVFRKGPPIEIDAAAKGTDNLLPLILDAVKAEATVGEIAGVLRDAWGEHQETLVL